MFRLAWRNIWRNKRRTAITLSMVAFAVGLSVIHRSLLWGMYNLMIDNSAGVLYGHGQIHKEGYWKEQSIDNVFAFTPELKAKAESCSGVKAVFPRIQSFALASSGTISRHAVLMGIDPAGENLLSNFDERISKGSPLKADDKAVLLGAGLADRLKLSVGDTVVLLSQGYHGQSAAGKYPVKGIVDIGNPRFTQRLLYMPLAEAQWFYATENQVTAAVIVPENPRRREQVVGAVKEALPDHEVMTWEEMDKETIQAIQADSAGGMVFLFILYLIITFGLFSTLLMMTAERRHEFGMLIALGMRKGKIGLMLVQEIILIGFLGAIAGMVMVSPLIAWFRTHPIELGGDLGDGLRRMGFEPIITPAFEPSIFLWQGLIIFTITLVVSLYPFFSVKTLKPVSAMRN